MAMKWRNLMSNLCPQCSGELKRKSPEIWLWGCVRCDFVISDTKKSVVAKNIENGEIVKIEESAAEAKKAEDSYWDDPDII